MGKLANKTFFHFLFGFAAIISLSFIMITGATYLAQQDAEQQKAQASERDCIEESC